MANQGWPNASGGGVQTSSTARQSGRGEDVSGVEDWAHASTAAACGPNNDPLDKKSDQFEPAGQLAVTPAGVGGGMA